MVFFGCHQVVQDLSTVELTPLARTVGIYEVWFFFLFSVAHVFFHRRRSLVVLAFCFSRFVQLFNESVPVLETCLQGADNVAYIKRLSDNGPAEASGLIHLGDWLMEVDGQNVFKKSIHEVGYLHRNLALKGFKKKF